MFKIKQKHTVIWKGREQDGEWEKVVAFGKISESDSDFRDDNNIITYLRIYGG